LGASTGDSDIIFRNISREINQSNRADRDERANRTTSFLADLLNRTRESIKDLSTIRFDRHFEPVNENLDSEEDSSESIEVVQGEEVEEPGENLARTRRLNYSHEITRAERFAQRAFAEINEFWSCSDFSLGDLFSDLDLVPDWEDTEMESLMPRVVIVVGKLVISWKAR